MYEQIRIPKPGIVARKCLLIRTMGPSACSPHQLNATDALICYRGCRVIPIRIPRMLLPTGSPEKNKWMGTA